MANPQVQEFKKNLILQAAYKCFKANSFIEVTMDDIAAEAGFSKATLYQFFESKDAILFYILKENLETVCTEFQSIIDEMYDPCAALDKILNMSYRGFRDNSQLIISLELARIAVFKRRSSRSWASMSCCSKGRFSFSNGSCSNWDELPRLRSLVFFTRLPALLSN